MIRRKKKMDSYNGMLQLNAAGIARTPISLWALWPVLPFLALLFIAAELLGFNVFCQVFSFMDWNKPGTADDLPFCWTPFQGVVR